MKTIVGVGLLSLVLVVAVVELRASHPSALPASGSASQIYIHGTPVCVFRQGESIAARVGECDDGAAPGDDGSGDRVPDSAGPGMALPPGHPPVGPDTSPEFPDGGGRRLLI